MFEIVLKHVPDIFADTDSGRECERVGVCRCTFQRIRFHFKIQLGRCGKICCVGVDITVRCVISVMLGTVQSNKQDVMMLGSLCIIVLQDMDDFCVILFVCVIYFFWKKSSCNLFVKLGFGVVPSLPEGQAAIGLVQDVLNVWVE